jgi:micrococcal nuclease
MKRARYFPLWILLAAFALFSGAVSLPNLGVPTSFDIAPGEPPVTAQRLRVIDGDTLKDLNADVTYRVVNIDTPEAGQRARCSAERSLAARATQEVRALIARASAIEMRPTGRIDRYGRTIAFVLIDGRDLGDTLIAEGLARPWRGRREPWCDSNGGLMP